MLLSKKESARFFIDASPKLMTKQGLYSATPLKIGLELIKIIAKIKRKMKIRTMKIVEIGSSIGADTEKLMACGDVISFDIDFKTVEIAKKNTGADVRCESPIKKLLDRKLRPNLVYADPPWGGIDYKNKPLSKFKYDDISLSHIVKKLVSFGIIVILKVPHQTKTSISHSSISIKRKPHDTMKVKFMIFPKMVKDRIVELKYVGYRNLVKKYYP